MDSCKEVPAVADKKVDAIIADLEERGTKIAVETLHSKEPLADASKKLVDFMASGAKEFKELTGRNMTYAEMRAAWG
jgi:hypothetical protein